MTTLTDGLSDPLAVRSLENSGSHASPAEVRDFFALLKPRIMFLVVVTALVGMLVGHPQVSPILAGASLLMIAVGAGASGCLNMWWDADIDAVMTRTRTRPIPAGRVTPSEALSFGLLLSVGSVLALGLIANVLAASLLAATIVFYVVVYSMGLKRWTAQNIVIGGAAGALPPIVGQAAVTGTVHLDSIILFLIIFLWTPPHFWALALVKSVDYARAGVPMMPNVRGAESTRRQILGYTLLLAPCGVLPVLFGFGGLAYAVVSVLSGLFMLALALRIYRQGDAEEGLRTAQQMFGFSILYLFLLFAVLLAEHGLGLFRPLGLGA